MGWESTSKGKVEEGEGAIEVLHLTFQTFFGVVFRRTLKPCNLVLLVVNYKI
jgi:hypothetical protein